MFSVVIVMSNLDNPITQLSIQKIKNILDQNTIHIHSTKNIVPNHCIHYQCETDPSLNLQDLQNKLKVQLWHDKLDIAVLPQENRCKKLLIADMDSTMINQECIDELADFVGKKSEISAITELAMQGYYNFEESLIIRLSYLRGLISEKLEDCYNTRISLMDGGIELLKFMKSSGAYCVLASGGFTFFAEKIAKKLGFDTYHANILAFDAEQKLTGDVVPPILGRESKLLIMKKVAQEKNIALENCLAVGDGANDLDMICAAGLGVAYRAKPSVAEKARVSINFCDLRALIYLQAEDAL